MPSERQKVRLAVWDSATSKSKGWPVGQGSAGFKLVPMEEKDEQLELKPPVFVLEVSCVCSRRRGFDVWRPTATTARVVRALCARKKRGVVVRMQHRGAKWEDYDVAAGRGWEGTWQGRRSHRRRRIPGARTGGCVEGTAERQGASARVEERVCH